jgi:DNA mismatch endonuclease Vsr
MASVRSRGNRSTEQRLRFALVSHGVRGWRLGHGRYLGSPDFAFEKAHVAVFADGCFWHGCQCKVFPRTHTEYWGPKIARNRRRDRYVSGQLRRAGWTVIRLWEHDIRSSPVKCVTAIQTAIRYS